MIIDLQLFGGNGAKSGAGGGMSGGAASSGTNSENEYLKAYGEISSATYISLDEMTRGRLAKRFAKVDEFGWIEKLQHISEALNDYSFAVGNGLNSGQFNSTVLPIDSNLRGMAVKFSDKLSVSETLGLDNISVKDFNGLVVDVRSELERRMKQKK